MSKSFKALHIFRQDLRLEDNPSINYISENYKDILYLFVDDVSCSPAWSLGEASKWFLHHALLSLETQIQAQGGKLLFVKVDSPEQLHHYLDQIITQENIEGVFWNRRYDPVSVANDKKLKEYLQTKPTEVKSFNAHLLWEPWEIKNKQDLPFQVFTPFWKKALSLGEPSRPQTFNKKLNFVGSCQKQFTQTSLKDLKFLPQKNWDKGFYKEWDLSESSVGGQIKEFVSKSANYQSCRDLPYVEGTSKFSPYLRWGRVSIRSVWHKLRQQQDKLSSKKSKEEIEVFLKELGWREFAYHLLFAFPQMPDQPLREKFKKFPWAKDSQSLQAWQKGQTGYPIVDAGMRQLWQTGWMHNRVRMIVASFLVKHLQISWNQGALWFWDTLVDADLASNSMGWQWAAGSGADAAPYFRIFNPYLQGTKFDPDGDYVKTWIPELAHLDKKWIHNPHEASEEVLKKAKIVLGVHYPYPIVDHKQARSKALQSYMKLK